MSPALCGAIEGTHVRVQKGGGRTCTHVMSAPTARPAQQIWRLPASVHQATRSAHNPESYRGVSTCHRCYAGESRGRACACRRGRGTCAHVIRYGRWRVLLWRLWCAHDIAMCRGDGRLRRRPLKSDTAGRAARYPEIAEFKPVTAPRTPLGGCHGHLLGQIELPAGGLSVWALPANFRADLLICWISAGIL